MTSNGGEAQRVHRTGSRHSDRDAHSGAVCQGLMLGATGVIARGRGTSSGRATQEANAQEGPGTLSDLRLPFWRFAIGSISGVVPTDAG